MVGAPAKIVIESSPYYSDGKNESTIGGWEHIVVSVSASGGGELSKKGIDMSHGPFFYRKSHIY